MKVPGLFLDWLPERDAQQNFVRYEFEFIGVPAVNRFARGYWIRAAGTRRKKYL